MDIPRQLCRYRGSNADTQSGYKRTSGGTSKRRTIQESETPYGQIKAYGGRKKRLDLIIAKPYNQLISSEKMTCMTREKGPTAVQQLNLQGGRDRRQRMVVAMPATG